MTATPPIYLDYQATTPLDAAVFEAMRPYMDEAFGNPHSVQHAYGKAAGEAVERARAKVAALIGAEAREIVFTSGATEANNLAIKGAARFQGNRRRHVVTLATEHKCVLESCRALEREGFSVTFLPVQPSGLLDLDTLRAALSEDTVLVSIMGVNNEIGVIQPLAGIGALCRANGTLFHTDCAQAAGKIPLDVDAMNIDLMSLSAHKMYGPKGVGALYVRRRPRVRLEPLFSGGGQERGLRSGTLPAPLCVGFGAACAIAQRDMAAEEERIAALAHVMKRRLLQIPGAVLNGDAAQRWPGNLNVAFPGIDAEDLLASLIDDVALSTGSACTSATVEPSYVLQALGLDDDLARGAVRIGIGRQTREDEVTVAADRIAAAVERLRAKRPSLRVSAA